MSATRVLIADDHEAIRMVVRALVNMYVSDVATIETYDNGDDVLLALLPERGPVGLLVLDLTMPGYRKRLDLVQGVFELQPTLPTLVYTASDSPMMMMRAVDLGVLGYVVKGSRYALLQEAFEAVLLRQPFLDPAVDLESAARHPWWTLTAAERETIIALAKGVSLREIAAAKGRSYKTVTTHKYNASNKLGLAANAPLATYLADEGLGFELDEWEAMTNNVVDLFRGRFPVGHVEVIEDLLRLATGDEIGIGEVDRTPDTLEELADKFGSPPTMALQGLAMPLWRWQFDLERSRMCLYVIDAGTYRAFWYRAATMQKCDACH